MIENGAGVLHFQCAGANVLTASAAVAIFWGFDPPAKCGLRSAMQLLAQPSFSNAGTTRQDGRCGGMNQATSRR